jgi:hypothetical protein
MHRRDDKYIQHLVGNPEGKRPLLRHMHGWGGKIILKLALKKQSVRMWTGFIWIRIGSSGGVL